LKQLAWVILLSHSYVALEMNLAYYSGFNRLKEVGFGGMDNNCFAVSLVACMGLAFFLGFHSPRWWQKGLALLSAAVIGHAILFSFSRGGMLALGVTGISIFLLIPRQPRHYAALLIAVLVALRLAGPEVRERFALTFDRQEGSSNMRLSQWQ